MYKRILAVSSLSGFLILSGCSSNTTENKDVGTKTFKFSQVLKYNGEKHGDVRDFANDIKYVDSNKKLNDLSSITNLVNESNNKIIKLYVDNVIGYAKQNMKIKEKAYIKNYISEQKNIYKMLKLDYTKDMESEAEKTLNFVFGFNKLLKEAYPLQDDIKDFELNSEGYMMVSYIVSNDSEKKAKKEVDKTKKIFNKINNIESKEDFDLILNNKFTLSLESSLNSYTSDEALIEYKKMKIGDLRTSKLNVTDYKVEKLIKVGKVNEDIQENFVQRKQFSMDIEKMSTEKLILTMYKVLDTHYDEFDMNKNAYSKLTSQIEKDLENETLASQYEFLRNISVLTQSISYTDLNEILEK